MPVHEREFDVDGTAVHAEIDTDEDRVTLETAEHGRVVVDVDGGTAIVEDSVPAWADGPLSRIGIDRYEYADSATRGRAD